MQKAAACWAQGDIFGFVGFFASENQIIVKFVRDYDQRYITKFERRTVARTHGRKEGWMEGQTDNPIRRQRAAKNATSSTAAGFAHHAMEV